MVPTEILGKSLAAPMLGMLADAMTGDQFPWGTIVGTGGAYGVLAWYLWYDTSKGRPKREQEHQDTISRLEATSRADRLADQARFEAVISNIEARYESRLKDSDAKLTEEIRKKEETRDKFLESLAKLTDRIEAISKQTFCGYKNP